MSMACRATASTSFDRPMCRHSQVISLITMIASTIRTPAALSATSRSVEIAHRRPDSQGRRRPNRRPAPFQGRRLGQLLDQRPRLVPDRGSEVRKGA